MTAVLVAAAAAVLAGIAIAAALDAYRARQIRRGYRQAAYEAVALVERIAREQAQQDAQTVSYALMERLRERRQG